MSSEAGIRSRCRPLRRGSPSVPRQGTRAFAVPLVLVLLTLAVTAAFAVNFQLSSQRAVLERMYAHRLLLLASDSAFEEASAVLEGLNRMLPALPVDPAGLSALLQAGRNLKGSLALPDSTRPEATCREFQGQGVTLGPVRLASSDWAIRADRAAGERNGTAMRVQELGLLFLEVDVAVRAGSSSVRGTVSCRRYMDASPDAAGGPLVLNVLPRNMVLQVRGSS